MTTAEVTTEHEVDVVTQREPKHDHVSARIDDAAPVEDSERHIVRSVN